MVASDANAPVLAYEHGIMNTEESLDEVASGTGRVTTPCVAHADHRREEIGNNFMMMPECPAWSCLSQVDPDWRRRSARPHFELGGMVAALHEVHRCTTVFVSRHLMRELAVLTEATR
jgi:hypothetical protein